MIHERLAVASCTQRQCVKMKEPREACTCFTVGACHCCKCAQDCRGQVNIYVFVFWFYTQHGFFQFLFLPPALSRMNSTLKWLPRLLFCIPAVQLQSPINANLACHLARDVFISSITRERHQSHERERWFVWHGKFICMARHFI